MNESALMIVLRLIHILTGVFWAGTAMSIAWFMLPAQSALGQAGLAFIQEVMFRRHLRMVLLSAMVLTLLSGLAMYGRLTMVSNGTWTSSTIGMILGIGAVTGIIAGGFGVVVGNTAKKMLKLGGVIQASGGPATDEQRKEMQRFQSLMVSAYKITASLLVITVAAMASARYL
jgi:uncharacterized membrane protein